MLFGTEPARTAGADPTDLTEVVVSTQGTVITATTTEDELNSDGDCSLREAVQAANTDTAVDACPAGNGDDTIALSANIYTLSIGGNSEDGNAEGDLDVAGVLAITGADAATTIIQAGTNTSNGIDRVFHVLSSSSLTVQNVTIRYGWAVFGGSPHINGGGVYVGGDGLLSIANSILTDNRGANGGGVSSSLGATVNIDNSTISNNGGGSGGGGLRSLGTANIRNSTFYGNRAAFGGAVNVWTGTVNIANSTFSGNIASEMGEGYGGAIQNTGTLIISNSTFSGNTAIDQGGGIRNFGTAHISNSTFTGNGAPTGGGLLGLGGTVTVTNSIIASTTGGDCSGTIVSNDYNIDGDNTCNLTQPHDQPNTNPLLGSLADNGGATLTHALLLGSPAIDAGDCSGATISVDQRGVVRPQDIACDIGAYELVRYWIYLPIVTSGL
jgi:CSLREA domain-containing protein